MDESVPATQEFCPQCSSEADADAKFCKNCAFDLGQLKTNADKPPGYDESSEKAKYPFALLIVGLLFVGAVGVLIAVGIGGSYSAADTNTNTGSQPAAATLTLSEKARQIEERILRNESIAASDLEGLSPQDLRILRNVHFARYGRKYEKPGLGDYFFTRSWYKPLESYNDRMPTPTDKENVNVILAAENGTILASSNSNSFMEEPFLETDQTPDTGLNDESLTNSKAERAINQWLSTQPSGGGNGPRIFSGRAEVIGVQEFPQQNSARVDIFFIDLRYSQVDLRYSQGGESIKGHGDFAHYNDGRWVLTKVIIGGAGYLNLNVEAR